MPTKASVRVQPSGRTGHLGDGVDAMIVINGGDADEAWLVATAAAVDTAAAADAAAEAALAARLSAWAARQVFKYKPWPINMMTDGVSKYTINIMEMRVGIEDAMYLFLCF